jgi:16S rRNA C967 or C1407 C5-methylase (RsmB/RsmF family)
VLVDAECTHDGSLKHIIKYEQWGWDTFERRFLDADRVASITLLQLQLLTNGFRLLKPGGTLVYSTCSFTKTQNEGVVERFLTNQANAELQEVGPAKHWPCRPGYLPHTLRFDPVTSNTSGLFIAKIVKRVT